MTIPDCNDGFIAPSRYTKKQTNSNLDDLLGFSLDESKNFGENIGNTIIGRNL